MTRINGVHLEQDLRDLGWRPVQQMVEPNTGVPFTRWFPPANPDRRLPDREFIADNMDFPPHSEKGIDPLGEDTCCMTTKNRCNPPCGPDRCTRWKGQILCRLDTEGRV